MQVVQGNFFYHSNSRLGGLEDERQLLVEEQKLCRSRSRKFSTETNRRRKALEDRRKQRDAQEQRLIEDILKQRRQRVQDATERFQRAHLPPSQRRRQSFRRNIPNIEDALNEIQGALSSYTRQSSFLSSNSNISSCSPSPKPPTVFKSSHRKALSAVEAYTKLLQEQSMTCFKDSPQTEKSPEKQQDLSPQDSQLSDSANSDCISSKDSLENEDPNHSTKYSYPADPEHFKGGSSQKSPSDNIILPKRDAPGNTALDTSCPKQEALLDLRQKEVHDDRHFKHPSATEIIVPAKSGNSKDSLFGALPKPNMYLNDSTTDNASQEEILQQTGKERQNHSSQKPSSASINNLNKVLNQEPNTQKLMNAASLQHACLSNIQSDMKCLKCPEVEAHKCPVSSRSVCGVRFIKGILKKQSKYMSGDPACALGSGHVMFTKQVALAIRDSVELTRSKTKDEEGNNGVKKKLRWFDEVHVDTQDKEGHIMKQMKGKSNLRPSYNNSEDHQLSLSSVSGASKPGPGMTPAASTSYHFTKQAWADVGVQVSLAQERAEEVKAPRSSTRTGGPKVPRRERSSRAAAGPVSSRARKGTVIRPQSATEVSQIAKTQGKIMMPRPPPRMESVEEKSLCLAKTPYGMDQAGVNCKQAVERAQDNSEGFLSPHTHSVIRAESNVAYTPMPPSYTYPVSKGNTKGPMNSAPQEAQGCSRRRGMVYNEKGLCLDCTPTDEEISQLWHGVRTALATKEEKNKLRKQALDSGRGVRKPCVEPSRAPPGSGNRRLPQPTKGTTEPLRPFSFTNNLGFAEEGLLSAAQLHLAHAGQFLAETDLVAAMETAQTQRPGTVQQHSQQQGPNNISLEEQKILLSLDRLNHQLYCVREQIGGNAGTRGLVFLDAPPTREGKLTTHQKNRSSSANNRSRNQKKL
ncbi:hypothetical protein CgunFtcFv8_010898 [Champsocephalus gunnari]|uniref:Centrosomal protein of 126 kDa n=1 Tax=Champsocephalus gunnari TaxID=52237 RepID=A0AAN8DWY0_CHAGU|nr:hypothetical protein CgunFtcFv8_010898 [Champsocephalus gunnari]